jgi:hypothetical protein
MMTTSITDMGQLSPTTHERLQTMLEQPSPDLKSPQSMTSSGGPEMMEISTELDGVYDMMDYADRYFNDHEKDVGGTLMKSFKKRKQSSSSAVSFCLIFIVDKMLFLASFMCTCY